MCIFSGALRNCIVPNNFGGLITGERSVVYIASYNTVRVRDEEGGNAGGEALPEHEDVVTQVAVSADGRTLVSRSDDGTVRVWDAESGSAVGSTTAWA